MEAQMSFPTASSGRKMSLPQKQSRSKSMSCSSDNTSRNDLNSSMASISLDNDTVFPARKASEPSTRASFSRRNTFKGFAQSITGMMRLRRLTLGKLSIPEQPKPKPKEENTYKTDPEKGEVFIPEKVQKIATEIIESEMNNVKYDARTSGSYCCDLASKIKSAIKNLHYRRYRIVCQVVIGEIKEQGIEAASRCVWDEKRDNYTCVNYRNDSLFVSAMIYGIYFE